MLSVDTIAIVIYILKIVQIIYDALIISFDTVTYCNLVNYSY